MTCYETVINFTEKDFAKQKIFRKRLYILRQYIIERIVILSEIAHRYGIGRIDRKALGRVGYRHVVVAHYLVAVEIGQRIIYNVAHGRVVVRAAARVAAEAGARVAVEAGARAEVAAAL